MASGTDTVPAGATRKGRAGWGLTLQGRKVVWAWSFLALPIVFYCWIRFYPTIQAFWMSLTDWDLLRPATFIWFDNYQKLIADPVFWKVFGNTFAYLIIGTPVMLADI